MPMMVRQSDDDDATEDPMGASISSKLAMANAMVPTVDDEGEIVGSRMAMRVKA